MIKGYATRKKAKEIWKPIPGYEGLYEASSLGQIRSAPGKTTSSARFAKRVWNSRIMKVKIQTHGNRKDFRVELWKDNKHKTYLVARLVAMAFHGMPEKGFTVNHINGDSSDNRPENLEWVTLTQNIKYGFENGQFDSFMKKVVLIRENGECIDFRSRSQASLYLGRCVGYVSERLNKNIAEMYSVDGECFRCVQKEVG